MKKSFFKISILLILSIGLVACSNKTNTKNTEVNKQNNLVNVEKNSNKMTDPEENKSKVSNINENQASNTSDEETFNEEENFYNFSDLKNIKESDISYEKSKDGKTLNNYKVAIINENNEGNFEYKHLIKNYKTEVNGVEYSGDLKLHHTTSKNDNKNLIMIGHYTGNLTAK